jgi:hypothetical protein
MSASDFFASLRSAIARADSTQEPYLSERNKLRRARYTRESAELEARDPDEWRWRTLAGCAVQRRALLGPMKLRMVADLKRLRA